MKGRDYKKLLKERGVSVSFVSEKLNVNRSQLSRFLNESKSGSYITEKQLHELKAFIENFLGVKIN